jgi:hypothetical protein
VVAAPAVLVMAGAARPRSALRELLGDERADALERLLVTRATDWGAALSAGRVAAAGADEHVGDALARFFADADADADVDPDPDADAGGAVVVIWPVLPRWRSEHAFGVLDDLAAGCQASVAPVFDSGLYLLALARVIPGVLDLPADAWESPHVTGLVLAPINEADAPVGLVRPERALRRPADVRAALADPLLDEELRELLAR